MKKRLIQTILVLLCAVGALSLCSCSNPWGGPDQFDIGQANALQHQAIQAQEATRMMAGRSPSRAPLQPLRPLPPIR